VTLSRPQRTRLWFKSQHHNKEVNMLNKRLSIILVLGLTLSSAAWARDCNFEKGEDRWSIKTSVPQGALTQNAQEVDLQSLIDSPNPTLSPKQKAAIAKRRWAGRLSVSDKDGDNVSLKEGDMISVEGFLYRARCQKDGDFHLEIGVTSNKGSHCLIVEVPDPDEIPDDVLKDRVVQVRQTLDSLDKGIFNGTAPPVPVKIAGQFFVDAHHISAGDPGGNRGTKHCATNVWEIHPITDLEVQSQ
jgi:hypothetical protein